jgi:alkanesulfonate monooxygenase SsuD/methylene tetrahydromethanopterin reductase-like flavin-dependent oxidoreductase (luciferase family)
LGTSVVVLPFESAVRLAEDASVVDALTSEGVGGLNRD